MKPARWWLSVRRREPGYEGDRPFSIPEEVARVHLVEVVPTEISNQLEQNDPASRRAPVPRGFVVVLGLVALRNGGALLPVQSGRDDLVLIIGWRNMVPSVLTPDVCVLCEKSVRRDHDQSGVREISAVTDLDPKGGRADGIP